MRTAAAALRACLLHRYDWSESSLIVEVFTRERGRIALVAKGAKRPYSQWRAVLLPFQPMLLTLGRQALDEGAEIFPLRQAEWVGGCPVLGGAALFSGFYLNELLMKMLPRQDPHPRLYEAYEATLPALTMGEAVAQSALRAFELLLLREAGWLPDLSCVTLTLAPLRPDGRYRILPESGVVPLEGAALTAPQASVAGLERGVEGLWLSRLAEVLSQDADPVTLREACAPALASLRPVLRELLQYHLGRSMLRSRQVLQGVQRLLESPSPSRKDDEPARGPRIRT